MQLAVGISDRPVNLVEEGVDCVIRGGALSDSSMVAKVVHKDRFVTCASPRYLERHGVPQSPEELLEKHALVGYFGSATTEIWPLQLRNQGTEYKFSRFDLFSNDSAGQIAMIANGLGIGQTHSLVVARLLKSGALVPILEDWNGQLTPISVMYPSTRRMSRRAKLFVEWLTRYLKQFQD